MSRCSPRATVDAVFGFAMSSAINLAARGVPMDDIVVLNMGDYGVELYGNVINGEPGADGGEPGGDRGFPARLHQGPA